MLKRRALALAALLLALSLVAAACSSGDDEDGSTPGASAGGDDLLSQVMASGELKVSTDPKYPPQSELVNGQWQGFDIDVATEIAERMGLTTKFITPSWKQVISGNWQGRMDVSVGSVTATEDRAEVLRFTSPYYYTPAGVAVHEANSDITDPADLTGRVVGVAGATTYQEYLEGTLSIPGYPVDFQITGVELKTYETDSLAIQDLAKGDCLLVCAAFSAVPTLQNAVDQGKPIKLLGEPQYYEPLVVAVDKMSQLDSTSLGEEVSSIVDEMHSDGTLSELSCKWYLTDITVTDPADAMDCSTVTPAA